MVLGLQPIQPTEAEIKLICPLMPEIAFRLQTGKILKIGFFPFESTLKNSRCPCGAETSRQLPSMPLIESLRGCLEIH